MFDYSVDVLSEKMCRSQIRHLEADDIFLNEQKQNIYCND